VKEETGYDIEITGLIGMYTDPRHIIAYSDGELEALPMHHTQRLRVAHYLEGQNTPYLG
jgi:hypothetical protein